MNGYDGTAFYSTGKVVSLRFSAGFDIVGRWAMRKPSPADLAGLGALDRSTFYRRFRGLLDYADVKEERFSETRLYSKLGVAKLSSKATRSFVAFK